MVPSLNPKPLKTLTHLENSSGSMWNLLENSRRLRPTLGELPNEPKERMPTCHFFKNPKSRTAGQPHTNETSTFCCNLKDNNKISRDPSSSDKLESNKNLFLARKLWSSEAGKPYLCKRLASDTCFLYWVCCAGFEKLKFGGFAVFEKEWQSGN
uniref:Uncharacterized protein n=1 Tax=Opuntia streptacantha TaxID=393608 RepID=A0A7C9EAW1_OPUST